MMVSHHEVEAERPEEKMLEDTPILIGGFDKSNNLQIQNDQMDFNPD